jgi:hypothetical protein
VQKIEHRQDAVAWIGRRVDMLGEHRLPQGVAAVQVRLDQGVLRREQLVQPLQRYAGRRADRVHPDRLYAALVEQLVRRVQHLPLCRRRIDRHAPFLEAVIRAPVPLEP